MGSVLSGSWLDVAQGDAAQGRQYGKTERPGYFPGAFSAQLLGTDHIPLLLY